jgi:hypothetical protein
LQQEVKKMSGGEVLELEKQGWETERKVLMDRNLAVMEENFGLRERLTEWDYVREKCFFSLVLALKLDESAKGTPCNLEAATLWKEAMKLPPRGWDAWIRERASEKKRVK